VIWRIRQWLSRWWNHYTTERDLRRGVILRGRQPVGSVDKDEIMTVGHNAGVEIRQRVRVTAKVFRADTGRYEDLGEVASSDKGTAHIIQRPRS
jgi:hypothetical protein